MEVINRFLPATLVPSCTNCGYEDFILLIGNVFQFLTIDLAVPLATAAIVYGGIVLVVSGTNEGKRTQAKDIIKYAVWGLVLALASWLIIRTIMVGLGVETPFLPDFFQ
ncbi:MAG: hypothetical protein HY481_01375 [Candidatus Vogelbacteria bacterium]|nr:hypothetical protein [Candidatus Vogelbacteria bacterium]